MFLELSSQMALNHLHPVGLDARRFKWDTDIAIKLPPRMYAMGYERITITLHMMCGLVIRLLKRKGRRKRDRKVKEDRE